MLNPFSLLRRSLVTVTMVVVGLVLILLGLFLMPTLVINETSLNFLRQYSLSDTLHWKAVSLEIKRDGFWQRRIWLKIDALEYQQDGMTFKAKSVELSTRIDLHPQRAAVLQIGPVEILRLKGELTLQAKKDDQAETSDPFNFTSLRAYQDLIVESIRIEVLSLRLVQAERSWHFKGDLRLSGFNRHPVETIDLSLIESEQAGFSRLNLVAKIENYQPLNNPKLSLTLNSTVLRGKKKLLSLDMNVNPQSLDRQKLQTKALLLLPQVTLALDLNGERAGNRFDADFGLTVSQLLNQNVELSFNRCQTTLLWGSSFEDELDLTLSCKGKGHYRETVDHDVLEIFLPKVISFHLDSQTKVHGQIDSKKIWTDSMLRINRISNGPLVIDGQLSLKGETALSDPAPQNFNAQFAFDVNVPEFGELVQSLKRTSLPIPAPFNQLRGPVACNFKGDYIAGHASDRFPLGCQLRLAGADQKIDIDSDGGLEITKSKIGIHPHLDMEVSIDGIELSLPAVKIGEGFPPLTPDERFILDRNTEDIKTMVKEDKSSPAPSPFSYKVAVRTLKADSIQIFSNITKNPIPIQVALDLESGKPLKGELAIRDFAFDILRRKGRIQFFKVNIQERTIDGLVHFKNNDYAIFLKLFGTVEEPKYIFESEPPLSQSDILAVLLFGAKPELLEENKQRSVDETRAAIADGAISLLSMYYLASTPVESVGYNPDSGLFSARIALAEGLSLSVGRDSTDSNELGLRKRLGSGWIIDTSIRNRRDGQANKGVAMLKWGRRY